MKKLVVGTLVAVLVVGLGAYAMAGPYGPSARFQQAQYYGGGWGWGHGPMMGRGYGMGPGMMGWGYGCPGMMGWGYGPGQSAFSQGGQPLSKDNATQILQSYVARIGNPNLKLGEVTETDATFEGKVVTKDGSLVQKLVLEKATGSVYPAF